MRSALRLFLIAGIFFVATPAFAAPIVAGSFSTTWDTGATTEISINLGNCPAAVYWEEIGNETNNGTLESCNRLVSTIDFPSTGQYRVDYSGSFNQITFLDQDGRDKFRSVEQWGDSMWTNFSGSFQNVADLQFNAVDSPNLTDVTDLNSTFANATNFNSSLDNWDVSSITSMVSTFMGAEAFNQPLETWDVSNVTDMQDLFHGATAFNQPLEGWDVSAVTNMGAMFRSAESFNQPLEGWDVSSVVDMGSLFYGAISFNQPLNNWNVINVAQSGFLFYEASSFDQPLNNWNIINLTSAYGMFDQSALSTQSYTAILNAWSLLAVQSDVFLGPVPSMYCDTAQPARDLLTTAPVSWIITDEGPEVCPVDVVETEEGNRSEGTRVGVRTKRLEAVQEVISATSSPSDSKSITVSTFITAVRDFLAYLTENEDEISKLTPEEGKMVIIALRDVLLQLLKWIPGV